ncbi:pyridoxine 5'-phosphate synthase [Hoeflea sp.]|uniref:pyridoxine 5'-phosphate synthase n=1 Tax=Hoeflea sp. TaxID=1940281 RepID=UPI003B0121A2
MTEPAVTKLSVNLNAIAQLRNRRDLPWPSVTGLGAMALAAGAHGLTVHPRPDERHIRRSDLPEIRALIDDEFPEAEFNIEGYPTEAFMQLVEDNQPDQATLVPDDPAQATSDHGWDFRRDGELLKPIILRLKKQGIRVSLFADGDGDAESLAIAAETGTDRVEFYTGPYGACYDDPKAAAVALGNLKASAEAADRLGLGINAGHDLTVANLPALKQHIPSLLEVSIGHGLTADALQYGMTETVKRFLRACGHGD